MAKVLFKAVVPGNPIVKKNTQKVSIRYGRPIKYSSPQYIHWRKAALQAFWLYPERPRGLIQPMILCCGFYMSSNRRVDISALYEGIQDVLVEAGVIEDDYFKIIVGHDGSRVYVDPTNPRLEFALIAENSEITHSPTAHLARSRAKTDNNPF